MSSALRNSLHRRNHKERSQLAHRSRLGILEKHKDYVQRARDFHSKQDRIKRLKEKAANRNKDEFYFGMIRSKTQEGVHVKDRGNVSLPTDIVKVLKTQDENYIRAVRQAGLKKIDKLKLQLTSLADLTRPGKVGNEEAGESDDDGILGEEELGILQKAGILPSPTSKSGRKSKAWSNHIVFISNADEASKYKSPATASKPNQQGQDDGDSSVDLGWEWPEDNVSTKKPRSSVENDTKVEQGQKTRESLKKEALSRRRELLKELAARIKRDTNLQYARRELEMQRLMMGKGARRKIRGIEEVEGEERDGDDDDEDALEFKGRRRRKFEIGMEDKQYKPRVYKWEAERKK